MRERTLGVRVRTMSTPPKQVVVDAADPQALGAWWADLVGWRPGRDDDGDVTVTPPPGEPGIGLLMVAIPAAEIGTAAGGHRLHLDLRSTTGQEQADLVERAERRGARRIDIGQGD